MQPPKGIKYIEISPYPVDFGVYVEKNQDLISEGTDGCVYVYNGKILMCLISKKIKHKVIVHECMHVLDIIESHIKDNLRGEARAYLVEHIFSLVLSRL